MTLGVPLIMGGDSVPIQRPPNIAISPFDDEFGPGIQSASPQVLIWGSAVPSGGEHTVSVPCRGCADVRFGRPLAAPDAEPCMPLLRLSPASRPRKIESCSFLPPP